MTPEVSKHTARTFQHPHKEGEWREKGLIVGWNKQLYPKLFVHCGTDIQTWKDGINE